MNYMRSAERVVPAIFLTGLFLTLASSVFAQSPLPSFTGCLPPTAGDQEDASECSLTYRPPPSLKQDIRVSECQFIPSKVEADKASYQLMNCSVSNGSNEPIESFRYGIRYFDQISQVLLAEVGFEELRRFSTANIEGDLQPGEKRLLSFIGPEVPLGTDHSRMDVVVEVIGVYVPRSRMLR